MIVVGCDDFSRSLAQQLDCGYHGFKPEYYIDGEPCPRLDGHFGDIRGQRAIFVLRAEQRPNREAVYKNLHKATRVPDSLRFVYGAKDVDAVIPYFWLARQDTDPNKTEDKVKAERDAGKDVGAEYMARSFGGHGVRRVIAFNPHFMRGSQEELDSGLVEKSTVGGLTVLVRKDFGTVIEDGSVVARGVDIYGLSGIPAIARYMKSVGLDENTRIVGPDFSSTPLGRELKQILGINGVSLRKHRIDDGNVDHDGVNYDAEGASILLIDDMLTSMKTSLSGLERVHNKAHSDICAVHGVLPPEGHQRAQEAVRGAVRRVVTTNTIENDYARADVIPELVEFFLK